VIIVPIAVAVIVLTVVLWLTMIVLLRQRAATPQQSRRPSQATMPARAFSTVLCPKCHTPMRSGFTTADRGIAWCDGDKKIPGRMSLFWLKAALPNTLNNGLSLKLNTAWRCEQCALVVIDHSSLNKLSNNHA
jgi:hypothetical protein